MIRERLQAALAPESIDIQDDTAKHAGHAGARGGGGHFIVRIVSTAFAGKTPVQRHRMVFEALGDAMQTEIHALSIDARTPDET
ncbi:BolA family protein [Thiohalobacter sp.]|uniref:BolA family protein n=1 Tax=Thiohalobacter sp. TaxID=2025948 RepID=UPI00294FF7FF|nr:BolA family protein [Thiohalobacter sp.]